MLQSRGIETNPIILYRDDDAAPFSAYSNRNPSRVGVLYHIVDCFTNDPVETRLDLLGKPYLVGVEVYL